MTTTIKTPDEYVNSIRNSCLSIYQPVTIGGDHWIPTPTLELILNRELAGISLAGLPLRTRSKVVKEHICKALGYPIPASFKKTHPRFPGQDFDTYTQKSNNLQIWNEEITPTRRYVVIGISETDKITRVKVLSGDSLARYDTTGTLTQKYQARLTSGATPTELVVNVDTNIILPQVAAGVSMAMYNPTNYPLPGQLLPIRELFGKLSPLIGQKFPDRGRVQERNRGADLHRLVCQALGYPGYQDNGQFPDVLHQLLEVKLQTSPTIDLGLVTPDSTSALDVPMLNNHQVRHCDVRYALFCATTDGLEVVITHFFLTTGAAFFSRFPQFGGKVLNKKLQLPLPGDFFD
ncbi:restriction endonuclease [Oryzomonas japonica]|uniref:Restriction endonuclease n=1 Tax=Oryzomonas japonica TaxID=2603858 RepID=A0A7J4ZVF0_9BACT|nr:restriction endonuclease [Oryzomonas japonica]KAB0667522.1 restriction endonuclease [Oryzomonas japonica]